MIQLSLANEQNHCCLSDVDFAPLRVSQDGRIQGGLA